MKSFFCFDDDETRKWGKRTEWMGVTRALTVTTHQQKVKSERGSLFIRHFRLRILRVLDDSLSFNICFLVFSLSKRNVRTAMAGWMKRLKWPHSQTIGIIYTEQSYTVWNRMAQPALRTLFCAPINESQSMGKREKNVWNYNSSKSTARQPIYYHQWPFEFPLTPYWYQPNGRHIRALKLRSVNLMTEKWSLNGWIAIVAIYLDFLSSFENHITEIQWIGAGLGHSEAPTVVCTTPLHHSERRQRRRRFE